VHGSASLVGGIHSGAHPLEVAGLTPVDGHIEIGSGRLALTSFGGAFDGQCQRVGDRFALQLKEEYVATVHAVTPVEMGARTVKALTLIAYHQPILQSHLVRMLGEVAYEEVQHLRGMGLVHTEPNASTLELTTTRRFAEYFGIPSSRPEEIRKYLEGKLGVTPTLSVPTTPPPTDLPAVDAKPLEERYVDDGTVTVDDRKAYSLRSGATSTALPTVGGVVPGERMSESEMIGEIGGGKRITIIVVAAVVVLALKN